MKKPDTSYRLRLPPSIKQEVERRAKSGGISVNRFIAMAVTEKLAAMNTTAFFLERRAKADFLEFDRIMN